MIKTLTRLGAAALAAGALALTATPALAAPADTDPPIVDFQPGLTFFAGSVLSTSTDNAAIPARANWSQFDADGICDRGGQLYRSNLGYTYPSISASATSYTGSFGATGYNRLELDSYDCAGNVSTDYFYSYTSLVQQGAFTLSAGWKTQMCQCWSGGGDIASTKKGATATLSFYGSSAALIGVKGTNRGSAKIYIDGVLQTTVNANQPNPNLGQNRVVIYASKRLPERQHTIKVVTTTLAKFDIDGLVSAY